MPDSRTRPHGRLRDGREAVLHDLAADGLRATVSTFGAALVTLAVPDREGHFGNVLLGLPTLGAYVATDAHFGGLVGRYANRIAGRRFELDGTTYTLPRNAGANTLHGGPDGFDKRLWAVTDAGAAHVALRLVSPDGDNGFPGTLTLDVVYTATAGALRLDMTATADRATVLNPISHAYFNLAGEGEGDVLDHEVAIAAGAFTPTDASQIPTGERRPVADTPFDFRTPAPLRPRIRGSDPQMLPGRGFDHNFVLDGGPALREVASAYERGSGRRLTVSTTRPGLQFYTGNSLDGSAVGTSGRTYRQGDGLCFEAQGFPDAVNRPEFPSSVLRPGERFTATTVYAFAAE